MFAWVNKSTVSLFWFETPIWLCSWMIQCWLLCLSSYLPSQRTLHFFCVMLFKIENLCDIYAEDWNDLLEILELSIKSPSFSPLISSAFTHNPLFQWYLQSKEILLNLGMKCWNSAFNAQGSRVIIVPIVHVGAEKIYVSAAQAVRKYAEIGRPCPLIARLYG
jgi:hypothetical protein